MGGLQVRIYLLFRSVLRGLRLNRSARALVRFMPKPIQSWYSLVKLYSNERSLVSVEELKPELRKAVAFLVENHGIDRLGDYLEFGVCRGTSLACMHQVLSNLDCDHVRLFGFDSFEGLPESAATDDDGRWRPGQFNSDYRWTRKKLTENGVDWKRTHLIEGWFSETLTETLVQKHRIEKTSVIMVDCDMYLSAKEALDFCAPLIKDQTVIFFDDWNTGDLAAKNMGEKRAFDEFLHENPRFTAEKFGSYSYRGIPNGEIFLVTNTEAHPDKTYEARMPVYTGGS